MRTVYMVVGCPCSGKSWVCEQLHEQFCYVRHDDFIGDLRIYIAAINQAAITATRPLLIETPFSMSQLEEPLNASGRYHVVAVFILEQHEELERRYRAREGKPIPIGHLSRQKTYAKRAQERQAFSGTSAEVLRHLKGLAPPKYPWE